MSRQKSRYKKTRPGPPVSNHFLWFLEYITFLCIDAVLGNVAFGIEWYTPTTGASIPIPRGRLQRSGNENNTEVRRMLSIFVYCCDIVEIQLRIDCVLLENFSERVRSWFIEIMDGLQDGETPDESAENTQQKTANIVSRMALAHELLMDDSFKIQSELPQNS